MRSTKDLKDIVSGSRAKSKMNGIAGQRDIDLSGSTYDDEDSKVNNGLNSKYSTNNINTNGEKSYDDLKAELKEITRKFG